HQPTDGVFREPSVCFVGANNEMEFKNRNGQNVCAAKKQFESVLNSLSDLKSIAARTGPLRWKNTEEYVEAVFFYVNLS
ncbi:MAG: hypothetical protein WA185_00115, partial [Candidatus Acidiferrales bacterium]